MYYRLMWVYDVFDNYQTGQSKMELVLHIVLSYFSPVCQINCPCLFCLLRSYLLSPWCHLKAYCIYLLCHHYLLSVHFLVLTIILSYFPLCSKGALIWRLPVWTVWLSEFMLWSLLLLQCEQPILAYFLGVLINCLLVVTCPHSLILICTLLWITRYGSGVYFGCFASCLFTSLASTGFSDLGI